MCSLRPSINQGKWICTTQISITLSPFAIISDIITHLHCSHRTGKCCSQVRSRKWWILSHCCSSRRGSSVDMWAPFVVDVVAAVMTLMTTVGGSYLLFLHRHHRHWPPHHHLDRWRSHTPAVVVDGSPGRFSGAFEETLQIDKHKHKQVLYSWPHHIDGLEHPVRVYCFCLLVGFWVVEGEVVSLHMAHGRTARVLCSCMSDEDICATPGSECLCSWKSMVRDN